MDSVNIRYQIRTSDVTAEFNYQLHPETHELVCNTPAEVPEWVRLDHQKCAHCPLDSEQQPHCPLALHLHELVESFHDNTSIDEVEMELINGSRRVIETTTLQNALASILDFVYPSSGCPKTRLMRPQAQFHIPVGSEAENVFRITGMYLLGQYFRNKVDNSGDFDFNGLKEFYAELNILNKSVASRLKAATRSDAVKNAITLMDMYSMLIPLMLDDDLVELRDLFQDFLPEDSGSEAATAKSNHLERIKIAKLELLPFADEASAPDDEPEWLKEARARIAARKLEAKPKPAILSETLAGFEVAEFEITELESTELEITKPKFTEQGVKKPETRPSADQKAKQSTFSLELVPAEDDSGKPSEDAAIFELPDLPDD